MSQTATNGMRARVIDAIEHKQTSLTPWQIDLTSRFSDNLRAQTGCEDPDRYLDNHLTRVKYKQNTRLPNGDELDIFGVRWTVMKELGDTGIIVDSPIKEPTLDGYKFPEIRREFAEGLCRTLTSEPRGAFRMFSITMGFFERAWSLRGMENLLLDMCLHEAFAEELFERILEHHLELLDLVLDHEFEGVFFGDDWGQQKGLIMGPPLWRRFIKPGIAKLFEKIKSRGKYVVLHSCGDLRSIMPEVVDMGVDVYNTIQPEIYDLDELKREYGRDLSFYGAVSTQQFLPQATVAETRVMARTVLDKLGKGGGYILAPTHGVTGDIPVDNVLALVDEARKREWA